MSLVTLDTTTAKLQVLLGGAVNTNECPMTATVEDERKDAIGGRADTTVQRSYNGISTGGTAVDLVPVAPSNVRRKVTGFSFYNADDAEVTVTVRLYVDANTTRIVFSAALQTTESLFYSEDRGWYAADANANQKSNAPASSGASSTALSAAESAALRASTALSAATSLDTATDTAFSTGDSTTLSAATSQNLAQSTNISTALSTALSAADSAASA